MAVPMARPEQYQQASLPLASSSRAEASPAHDPLPTPADTDHHRTEPDTVIASIAADPAGLPHGLAIHRLPDDFWAEFHLEWEFRERHGMTPVSPAEFADMRDRADGVSGPDAPRPAGPTIIYERPRNTPDD